MRISDILKKELIFLQDSFKNKDELLYFLSNKVAKARGIVPEDLYNEVKEREKKISTGIGMGIAVPHARILSWGITSMAVAVLKEPLEYNSLDDKPVRLIFFFVSDKKKVNEHINILAKISFLVAEDKDRERFFNASSPDDVYNHILEIESRI